MKLYSAYMLKPVSTNVPASDAYMTLLPNYKGKTNMATLFRTIQEDIFDHQLNFVGIQVRTQGGQQLFVKAFAVAIQALQVQAYLLITHVA